ncbi:MAG: protein kinase [Planctomycetota bacterium]
MPEGESSAGQRAAQRLEAYYLASSDSKPVEDLIQRDDADCDELLELLALHELVEGGLDQIAKRGGAEILEKIESGQRIGPYRLLRQIGSGGMGVLYLAQDEVLGRLVAVKLLSRRGEEVEGRFLREAEILASLSHPNIVEVYARGDADGVPYIAMRYVSGQDPLTALREESSASFANEGSKIRRLELRVARTVAWTIDIARALHHAHERGIIHRDVKPSNILIDEDHPYVLDFGLAKEEGHLGLTQSGALVGTIAYMSPEQVRGDAEAMDRRTDIYSLGVSLYQLLSDRLPFEGRSTQAVARQVLQRDPPSLRRFEINADLDAIVSKAIEKESEQRYATARELAEDLERYASGRPVLARRLGRVRRSWRYLVRRKVASLAALILMIGLAYALLAGLNAAADREAVAQSRLAEARVAARRGDYKAAVYRLETLLDERPDFKEARQALIAYRPFDAHEDLMRQSIIRRGGEDDTSVVTTGRRAADLIRIASQAPAETGLADRVRAMKIMALRREHRFEEALALVDEWSREAQGVRQRSLALRAYLRAKRDRSALLPLEIETIANTPSRDIEDHFVVALSAGQISGGHALGLRAADAYLDQRPDDYWGHFLRAGLLSKMGRLREAREVYTGMIAAMTERNPRREGGRVDEKLGAAYYQRGLMNAHLQRFGAALLDLERAEGAVRSWELAYSKAHALRGLSRYEEALEAYRQSLSAIAADIQILEKEEGVARETMSADADSIHSLLESLKDKEVGVKRGLGLGLVERGKYQEAQAVYRSIAQRKGRLEAAETALAALEIARGEAAAVKGESAEALGRFQRTQIDLADLADEYPENLEIGLLRAKVSFAIGEITLRKLVRQAGGLSGQMPDLNSEQAADPVAEAFRQIEILLQSNPDRVDARYLRAELTVRYLLSLDRLLFDRRPRNDDLSQRVWDEFIEDRRRLVKQAADDLGYVREIGRGEVAQFQSLDTLDLLRGLVRYWNTELATAVAILSPLANSPARIGLGLRREALLYLGRSFEDLERHREARESYERALKLSPKNGWALVLASRAAAREGEVDRVAQFLAALEALHENSSFAKKELNSDAYRGLRNDRRLASFR